MNTVSSNVKRVLTVLIILGLLTFGAIVFAVYDKADADMPFLQTPIGYIPQTQPAQPVMTWRIVHVEPIKYTPPKPALRQPTRLPSEPAGDDVWARLRACESSDGRSSASGRYHGYFQFSMATWRQAGGTGHPMDHSYEHQKAIAKSWLAKTSWAQWPSCSRQLGLR